MATPKISDDRFWSLIDKARTGSEASAAPKRLAEVLNPLVNQEISAFGHMFTEKLCDLNQWRLWAAGYIIAGGMSDDSFHYFRSWIIGKGRAVFETAMKDPDAIGPWIDDREVDNELLEYVAVEILQERGGKDSRELSDRSPDAMPSGEPFEEETVAKICPQLAALFG
jgi:hypothetical protein